MTVITVISTSSMNQPNMIDPQSMAFSRLAIKASISPLPLVSKHFFQQSLAQNTRARKGSWTRPIACPVYRLHMISLASISAHTWLAIRNIHLQH